MDFGASEASGPSGAGMEAVRPPRGGPGWAKMGQMSSPPATAGFSQRLAEMAVTSELLAGSGDLADILHRLAQRAQELTGSGYAAISTFSKDGTMERFIYVGMDEREARALGTPPAGRGLLGALVRRDRPLRIDDLASSPLFTGWPEGHPDMSVFLGVPILAGGRTIGSLYATRVRGSAPFSDEDELAAVVLALQAAVTLSAALARERSHRLFLYEERERIAHDLHDGTIQSLYALGLQFDALAERVVLPEVREALDAGVKRINVLIGEIRDYIEMLEAESPATAPDLPRDIAFVVNQLVPPGIDTVVNLASDALHELTPRQVEDLIFLAREAISNAVRHSQGSRIGVDLRASSGEILLTVADNGIGYNVDAARVGLGSITMRTRSERLKAGLTIISIPGMGTTVRVAVPREPND